MVIIVANSQYQSHVNSFVSLFKKKYTKLVTVQGIITSIFTISGKIIDWVSITFRNSFSL